MCNSGTDHFDTLFTESFNKFLSAYVVDVLAGPDGNIRLQPPSTCEPSQETEFLPVAAAAEASVTTSVFMLFDVMPSTRPVSSATPISRADLSCSALAAVSAEESVGNCSR
jgi:hypothetical protein